MDAIGVIMDKAKDLADEILDKKDATDREHAFLKAFTIMLLDMNIRKGERQCGK